PTAERDGQGGASLPTERDRAEVVLCDGATLEGEVVDTAGRAVADAEIRLEGASRGGGVEELDVTASDAEGRFVLTDELLLGVRLVATAPGARGELTLAPLQPGETR